MKSIPTGKRLREFAGACLLLSLLAGCDDADKPTGPAPPAGAVGTSYPPDDRVSPNGKVRPTLSATTDNEDVHYHNPNTGTDSDYTLEVDRDADGKVERINFPNGGWREIDGDVVDNGDGTETYTADDGAEYTITKPAGGNSPDSDDDLNKGDDDGHGSDE